MTDCFCSPIFLLCLPRWFFFFGPYPDKCTIGIQEAEADNIRRGTNVSLKIIKWDGNDGNERVKYCPGNAIGGILQW